MIKPEHLIWAFLTIGFFRVLWHLRNTRFRNSDMLRAAINTTVVILVFLFISGFLERNTHKKSGEDHINEKDTISLQELVKIEFDTAREIDSILLDGAPSLRASYRIRQSRLSSFDESFPGKKLNFKPTRKHERVTENIFRILYDLERNKHIITNKRQEEISDKFVEVIVTEGYDDDKIKEAIPFFRGQMAGCIENEDLSSSPFQIMPDSLNVDNYCDQAYYICLIVASPKINSAKSRDDSVSTSVPDAVPEPSQDQKKERNESLIREFLKAEDSQKFDRVAPFFATSNIDYYGVEYPNLQELKKKYEEAWATVDSASNTFDSWDQMGSNMWQLRVIYRYKKKGEEEWEEPETSVIFFTFNSNNEIKKISPRRTLQESNRGTGLSGSKKKKGTGPTRPAPKVIKRPRR